MESGKVTQFIKGNKLPKGVLFLIFNLLADAFFVTPLFLFSVFLLVVFAIVEDYLYLECLN